MAALGRAHRFFNGLESAVFHRVGLVIHLGDALEFLGGLLALLLGGQLGNAKSLGAVLVDLELDLFLAAAASVN